MATTIRLVAAAATAFVALGFAIFAADQAGAGSKAQLRQLGEELGDPVPTSSAERDRERRHGPVRELVDDANDVLLAPFADVASSRNAWVQRSVPTLLALLAYGLGLALLANYLPRRARRGRASPRAI
jgi:hypothetical protein